MLTLIPEHNQVDGLLYTMLLTQMPQMRSPALLKPERLSMQGVIPAQLRYALQLKKMLQMPRACF
jgi:hypothetical protein